MNSLLRKHNKIKLSLLFLFIISFTIFYYIIINERDKKIDVELQNSLHDLKIHHGLTLDYFYTDAKSIQSYVSNDQKILNLLQNSYKKPLEEQAKNRKELYSYLFKFYKRIQTRGVLQFQFMFSDNTTFLRMHKPSKFNDDLSEIRYSYKYTNETKKVSYGFEQGKTSHSIRYVFPLFDKSKKHIGAAEVSLSTKFIQDQLVNSNKIHTHYIVDKKIFEVRAWKTPGLAAKYIQSVEHDDYIYTASSHSYDTVLRKQEENYIAGKKDLIAQKFKTKKPFSLYIDLKKQVKILSFMPVKNIKDKKVVAYIVSHTDNITVKNILRDSKYIIVIGFTLFVMFFYFFYKILSHRETLQIEVDRKTKKLQILNDNLQLRIQKEVEKNKKAQEQIYKAEKMLALGDMIGNIAHQWRQPLSAILTAASALKLEQELGTINEEKVTKTYDVINHNAQFLSKTIDEFSDLIHNNKEETNFSLNDVVNSFLTLTENTVKTNNIHLIVDIQDNINVNGEPNELTQSLLHIFNNSIDVLKEINDEKYIFINCFTKANKAIITIKDNGGGIDESILPRIFEPYYTTKHKSQGKGLSLHMTYNMITQGMNGSIDVTNKTYEYENKTYRGVEFIITIPTT